MVGLPTGTVTFLFSDVEGSTELLERLGTGYADELGAHRAIVREAVASNGGEIVDQRGEEVFAAFSDAAAAVAGAVDIQRRHVGRVMRVRIGLHTGEPALTGDGYLGLDVHRAARICAAGHGGQVLLSARTRGLVAERSAKDLGEYLLRGISAPERLYQVLEPGLGQEFVALRVLPAGRERRRSPLRRRGSERLSIEQLAWAARARLPATPPAERASVSRLAASLAAAARSSATARRFSAGVDRRALERRWAAYRTMSGASRRASEAAETVERQLALLDAVQERAQSLDRAARSPSPSASEIERATAALEAAVVEARPAIGKAAARTRPTLRRGIRRLGDEYVVITYDETGIERVNVFATMREARTFRRAALLADQAKPEEMSTTLLAKFENRYPGGADGYGGDGG